MPCTRRKVLTNPWAADSSLERQGDSSVVHFALVFFVTDTLFLGKSSFPSVLSFRESVESVYSRDPYLSKREQRPGACSNWLLLLLDFDLSSSNTCHIN